MSLLWKGLGGPVYSMERDSDADEDLADIEEAGQREEHAQAHQADGQFMPRPQEKADVAAHETVADAFQVDHAGQQVQGDGVHAHPDEGLAPGAYLPAVDPL